MKKIDCIDDWRNEMCGKYTSHLSRIARSLFALLVMFFANIASSTEAGIPDFIRLNLSVPLEDGIAIDVKIVLPSSGVAKAIVVVVPGTDGLSDPYFNGEIEQSEYLSDHRGGLTQALIDAGYAAAFFNQRGYAALDTCVSGNSNLLHSVSFVGLCINQKIRRNVSFFSITDDTEKVFSALKAYEKTKKLPQVVLAYSEGMLHVSALIEKKSIDPIGIVSVGGPIESMSDIMRYQNGREFYFKLIDTAFKNCDQTSLDISQLLACSDTPIFPQITDNLRVTIGGEFLNKSDIPSRRQFFTDLVERAEKQFRNVLPTETINGNFHQFVVENNWSGKYFSEAFAEKESSLKKIENFQGKVVYLFGTLDYLVPIPKAGHCPSKSTRIDQCQIRVIPDVGHIMNGHNLLPTEIGLQQIVLALDSVLSPSLCSGECKE